MKVLIAYVRPHMAQAVVGALVEAGCQDMLVHDVRRVVSGLRGEEYAFSVELGQRYEPMVALIAPVADDDTAARWINAARRAGRTGQHGDGEILVLPLEASHRISGLAG